MRWFLHDFLKWFPAAACGGSIAVSAVWTQARDWISAQAVWAWSAMNDPWIAFFVVFGLIAYAATIIWSGNKNEHGSGDTHIHHHYQTLPEKLEQALAKPADVIIQPDDSVQAHTSGTVETGVFDISGTATAITSLHGIYVGYIIASASGLGDDRRLDFAIVGYNGSTETIRISSVTGRIRAGVGNLRDYVKLATPLFQGVINAGPFTEFVLQMRQDVTAEKAQEYLNALEDKKHVGLDLRELDIVMSSTVNPEKSVRLPLWDGVNLSRRDDIVSTRNTILSVSAAVNVSATLLGAIKRADGNTETFDA
jgi:hypothetical protein